MKREVRMKGMDFQKREVVNTQPGYSMILDYFTHRKSGQTLVRIDYRFPFCNYWKTDHLVDWSIPESGFANGKLSQIVKKLVTPKA